MHAGSPTRQGVWENETDELAERRSERISVVNEGPADAVDSSLYTDPTPSTGHATVTPNGDAAMPEIEPIVSLEHVSVTYPGTDGAALSDISLTVPAGQYVCILGGNGSGKSTLLQLINALILPSEGAVRVFGMNTAEAGRALAIRSRAAYVFQHPEDQMVTSVVADDVAFGPENLRVPQPEIARRVDNALAAVGMAEHAQSDPADLSGGQQQRVAIAGALAMEPDILLLDEPCAMLDVAGRRAIAGIIARLRKRGITILHITHFMDEARAADRVLVLDRGRLTFDGTPQELFARENAGVAQALIEVPTEDDRDSAPMGNNERPLASGSPAVVFEHVSFSYATARNPRKRARRLFAALRPAKKRHSDAALRAGGKRHPGTTQHTTPRRAGSPAPLAVSDISFTAHAGTLTALVGHTGSGKSTTAELACALKLPAAGRALINGIDTADLARRRELRRSVGYVAQLPERQLFAETVYDDVAFGPRNLGLSEHEVDQRVRGALASVNLDPTEDLLARSPFALSGGQQRSVALAGVLAMSQPVLVLDEPMAGLDPRGRAQVRALIRTLKANGTTLIMVTHDMNDVSDLADQVIALDHGTIVAQGDPKAVLVELAANTPEAHASGARTPGAPDPSSGATVPATGTHASPSQTASHAEEVSARGATR